MQKNAWIAQVYCSYNYSMKKLHWLAGLIFFVLVACQPQSMISVNILDHDQVQTITTDLRIPNQILSQAGLPLTSSDRLLLNGVAAAPDQPLPTANTYTLQIRRAVALTVNDRTLQSSADTIGQALSDAGVSLSLSDTFDPPLNTWISSGMKITYVPSRELTISVDGSQLEIRSSAQTVGQALAEAGIPLMGMDYSDPAPEAALPANGAIRVVRVTETVILAQKSLPYKTDYQSSDQVELDQQQTIQAGQPGLSVTRTRIRYEDGQEVSRQTEAETIVRPPVDRIVAYGTKVVLHTTVVDGVQIQYWRSVQMFATAYSPCESGAKGVCYTGTSSGLPAGKGVVAVDPSLYSSLAGQRVYIPGYGFAVIGDVGGGDIIEQQLGISRKRWIDLGFSDAEYAQVSGDWSRYVTVFFLAPAPQYIDPLN